MNYDLNDPVTRALWDSYADDEKQDFESAYIYMKYLQEFVSLLLVEELDYPPVPGLKNLDPKVKERVESMLKDLGKAAEGGFESDKYHGKVVRLQDAKQLINQKVDVNVSVPQTVFPFKLARDVIIKNPQEAIAVGKCPCRVSKGGPSCIPEPMEVCFFLGDPHVSFVVEHNPQFRRIGQQEAIDILEDCQKRGLVSVAYFRKDMGNRMYAICNCCKCCCGGVKATTHILNSHGEMNSGEGCFPSGLVAEVGEECIGCGECVDKCQFEAISLNEEEELVEIDLHRCMGCAVCEAHCPTEAISMRAEPTKGGVLDLAELKKGTS